MKHLLLLLIMKGSIFSYASSKYTDTSKSKLLVVHTGNNCEKMDAIYTIINEAISVGAPTYNAGNHIGCYLIYEGAAYKILHKYGLRCTEASNILEAAIEQSYGNYTPSEKAWIMRKAFDKILGEPTRTK
jgi:hypothetical protein